MSDTTVTKLDAVSNAQPASLSTNMSIGVSLILLVISSLYIYITFRIMQTLWHVREIRNALQNVDSKALKQVLKDDSLISSVNECCDGGFLWLPLIGAGFNFIGAVGMGLMSVVATINAFRNK